MLKRALMCAVALLFAVGLSTAAAQESKPASKASAKKATKTAAKERTFTGTVTDTHCGAKGHMGDPKECIKKCVGMGSKYALLTARTKKVYELEPADKVANFAAERVSVKGTLEGNTVHVASITEAAAKKAAAKKAPAKAATTTKQ